MPKTLEIIPARTVRRNRNRALALEPRMLFDGALAADAAAVVHTDAPAKSVDVPAATGEKPADERLAESTPAASKTIVFVDYRVADADQLLAGVDPAATVVKIGQNEDGVQKISDTLAQAQDITSVQIVSHGGPGFLELGKTKLDQQALTGAYAAAVAGWREAMTAGGDLLLLGCDVAQGTQGAAFIAALAQTTHADVAASTGPTGAAALGGDWTLEAATGPIESRLAFTDAALNAYDGLLANALPDVQIVGMPALVKLGDTFNFTLRFDNADPTQVGFGPYVTLWVPATGPDGAGAAADDGLTVNSFTYLGQAVDPSLITTINLTVGAGGTVVHPFAKDASGALINLTVPTGFQVGDKLYIIKLPFGSFTPAQPVADIVVNATLSQDMDVDKTLGVRAGGGFQYGNDALDNPTTDPSLLASDVTATINPTLFKITSAINSPEGETATGGNFLNTLTVTIDVAPGQTLTNFDLLQSLPLTGANNGDIIVTNISATGGGVVTPAFALGTTSLTQSNYTNANSAYTAHWGSLSGTQTVTVTYFVPKTDQGGTDIIDPVSADDVAIQFGSATGSGGWTPHDARDPVAPVSAVDTNPAPTVTAKALAIQKTVAIAVDTGAAGFTPGDTLEYTINFQVSDYFAFDNLSLRDLVGDGQLVTGTPTLAFQQDGVVFGAAAVANVVATANPDKNNGAQPGNIYDGASILDFDLAAEFNARGLATGTRLAGDEFSNTMGGSHNASHQSGTTGQLKFQALIDDHYTDKFGAGYGGDSRINQSDTVDNTIRDSVTDGFRGGVLSVADGTTVVSTEADGTAASATIRDGSFSLTIYGRQDSSLTPIADLTQMNPGDYITYRLTYNLSEGDFENLKLASFLPLPVFDATDPDANDPAGNDGPAWTFDATTVDGTNAGTALPAVAQYKWAPSQSADYLGLTPTVTADDNANKITWDFGSRDNAIDLPRTIDILFTVKVSTNPFADGLFLTNLGQQSENNTFGSPNNTQALVQIKLNEPALVIKEGVVSSSNGGAVFVNTGFGAAPGGGVTWQAPGTATGFTGTLSSNGLATPVDANITGGVDGGDLVRFAVVVENTGASTAGAFDVSLKGTVPAGFTLDPTTMNFKVTRGDGAALTFTGIDGTVLDTNQKIADAYFNGMYGGGIKLDDGAGAGSLGAKNATSGTNIAVVTFDVKASDAINASDTVTSTATLVNFAGAEGSANHVPNGVTDLATVTTTAPNVTIAFQGGGAATSDDTTATHTTGANVVIGEYVYYDIKVTLPEGTTQNVRVDDLIPPGLAYDPTFNGSGYQIITAAAASNGQLGADFNAITFNSTPGVSGNSGADGAHPQFNFGTTVVAADNVATNNSFIIRVKALVSNVTGNQGIQPGTATATTLTNDAQLTYLDPDGPTGAGAAVDQTVNGADPVVPKVTVVEPTLTVTSAVNPTGAVDAGDPLTYTITISNTSGTDAFDINFTDLLNAGINLPTITSVTFNGGVTATDGAGASTTGTPSDNFEIASGMLRLKTGYNVDVANGGLITIFFDGTVVSNIQANTTISNTANVFWSSLNDAAGAPANAIERSGADIVTPTTVLSAVALNNYALASATTASPVADVVVTHALVGTSETGTTGSNLGIGEIAEYELTITLPEGVTPDLQLKLAIPAGMVFLPDAYGAGSPFQMITAGFGGAVTAPVATGGAFVDGTDVTVDFASITVTSNNVTNDNTFKVRYKAVVTDIGTNTGVQGSQTSLSIDGTHNNGQGSTFGKTVPAVATTVVEPVLAIDKSVVVNGAGTTGDAGDTAVYTIVIKHNDGSVAGADSLANAYDVTYSDPMPAQIGATHNTNLTIAQVTVMHSTLGDITNRFEIVGGTLRTIAGQSFDLDLAQTVTITINGVLKDTVTDTPLVPIDSTATINYTNLTGNKTAAGGYDPSASVATDHERSYTASDTAPVTADLSYALTKTISSTSSASTAGGNLVVGESVTFDITATFGEGTTSNALITDQMPVLANGMRLEITAASIFTTGANVSFSGSALPTIADSTVDGINDKVTFNLGTVTNIGQTGFNAGADDKVVFRVTARVTNTVDNQAGDTFNVPATLDVNSGGTVLNATSTVTLVEPAVTIDAGISMLPATLSTGQTIEYTITLGNASGTDAFDLNYADQLPAGIVIDSFQHVAGTNVTAALTGVGTAIVGTVPAGFDLANGQTSTFKVVAHLTTNLTDLGDTVHPTVTWTSLDGVDANERGGADGVGGALNDYAAVDRLPAAKQDTLTVNEDAPVGFTTAGILANDQNGDGVATVQSVVISSANGGTIANLGGGNYQYTPPANFNGTDTFTYTIVDTNGDTSTTTVTVTVAPVNDTPVFNFNAVAGGNTFTENGAAVVIDADMTVTDVDLVAAGRYEGAVLTLNRQGGANAQDVFGSAGLLGALTQGGSLVYNGVTVGTVTTNSGGALVLTFNVNATPASVNGVLQAVTYTSTADNLPATVNIAYSLNDSNNGLGTGGTVNQGSGGALTGTGVAVVNVTQINDPPVNTVGGARSTNENTTITFTGANTISIADPDAGNGNMTVTLTVAHGTLSVTGAGAAVIAGNGTSTVTINGNTTDVNVVLASLGYTALPNVTAADTLTIVTNDNGNTPSVNLSDTDTVAITLVDDAPVNTVPSGQTTPEDIPITFSTGAGNAIQIADVDAFGGSMTVTISVPAGTGILTLTTPGALVVTGNGTGTITITGTVAGINTSLGLGLVYDPPLNVNGNIPITVTTNDNGNTGTGGPLTDVDTFIVGVGAVNDPPDSADKSFTTVENTPVTFTAGDFAYTDPDAGDTLTNVRIDTLPAVGQLLLNGVPVVAGQIIPVAQLNRLSFMPAANTSGPNYANFTFSVQDPSGAFDPVPNRMSFNVDQTPFVPPFVPPPGDKPAGYYDDYFARDRFPADPLTLERVSDSDRFELRILESTDRGFRVSRTGLASEGASNSSVEGQQKGGDRLFVNEGIQNMNLAGGQGLNAMVPADAFGHTGMGSTVQLSAASSDGSPLPGWLVFDPVSGLFSGTAPANQNVIVEVRVTARDNEGREASTTFRLEVKSSDNPAQPAPRAPQADAQPRGVLPFAEQLRKAKPAQDPLLAGVLNAHKRRAHAA